MTIMTKVERECHVCGDRHTYVVVMSTSTYGYPDLDHRPGGFARHDGQLGIGRCEQCGYRDFFFSDPQEGAAEAIRSEAYRQATEIPGPELARDWHCYSVLSELAGDRLAAGWGDLRAAWACDDTGAEEASRVFRATAVKNFSAYLATSAPSQDDRVELMIVLLDLQRRIGNFEDAAATIKELEGLAETDEVRAIVALQSFLIKSQDIRSFTLEDTKKYVASPERWIRRQERRDSARPWWHFW